MISGVIDYLKLRSKTLIVLVILFILLDMGLRAFWDRYYADPGATRLVNSEVTTIYNLKEQVDKAKGIKVLFIGDSQTYGSAVKSPQETVPFFVERELRNKYPKSQINVFNCAFKGFGITENYLLLKYLAEEDIDLVIYNVSTSWFGRPKAIDHTNLTGLLGLEHNTVDAQLIDKTSLQDRLSSTVERELSSVWKLYSTKSALVTMALGKPIRDVLKDSILKVTNPQKYQLEQVEAAQLYQPWMTKDWSKEFKSKHSFGKVTLADSNLQFRFYKQMLQTIKDRKMKAIFYVSPQNMEMLSKYQVINDAAWSRFLRDIRGITQSPEISYYDYSKVVDSAYFTDTIHMIRSGNERLAKQLAPKVAAQLEVTK